MPSQRGLGSGVSILVALQKLKARTPPVPELFLARGSLNCIMRRRKPNCCAARLDGFRHPECVCDAFFLVCH